MPDELGPPEVLADLATEVDAPDVMLAAWRAVAQVYESATLRGTLLLCSDGLLLLGLYCAGRLVGWRAVAQNIMAVAHGGAVVAAIAILTLGAQHSGGEDPSAVPMLAAGGAHPGGPRRHTASTCTCP